MDSGRVPLQDMLREQDFAFLMSLVTPESLTAIANVVEQPPLTARQLSELFVELTAGLNVHHSVASLIQHGISVISCMLHLVQNFQCYGPLSSCTFERVRNSQRRYLATEFARNVTSSMDTIRLWLLQDFVSDAQYETIVNSILTAATEFAGADVVYAEELAGTGLFDHMSGFYQCPLYVRPVDLTQYSRSLRTVTQDTDVPLILATDSYDTTPNIINDILFLMSIKHMAYKWRSLLTDQITWLSFRADQLVDQMVLVGIQIPPCMKYVCNIMETVSEIRTFDPFNGPAPQGGGDRASLRQGPEDIDPSEKLQNMVYIYTRSFFSFIRHMLERMPGVHVDLDYSRYRLSTWRNHDRYTVLQSGSQGGAFGTCGVPCLEDPDMFCEEPCQPPRLFYPVYDQYTHTTTDEQDRMNTNVVRSYMGNYKDIHELLEEARGAQGAQSSQQQPARQLGPSTSQGTRGPQSVMDALSTRFSGMFPSTSTAMPAGYDLQRQRQAALSRFPPPDARLLALPPPQGPQQSVLPQHPGGAQGGGGNRPFNLDTENIRRLREAAQNVTNQRGLRRPPRE
ncbi:protein U14 [Proboscivirus elephantidbeta4]|uniref:Protein U14 n=1 Tax=Elephant endotheliotropic herpesvirus 4 TaxID=548914 RepID=A0A0S1TQZ0_9BETA|nr:protein U14 [Elephant endotheliotropic herpesvirus 4]ALM25969.1 protein U14 [Elephant endotheliotropic herpesvirus 4]